MRKWFISIYLLTNTSKGIANTQLAKQVGVTQRTAWFMAQRIREAYNQDSNKLQDDVEIDETYVGGKEKNKHANKRIPTSKSGANKEIIVGTIQKDIYNNQKLVKAKHIKNTKIKILKKVIHNNIDVKENIISDDFKAYHSICKKWDNSYQ